MGTERGAQAGRVPEAGAAEIGPKLEEIAFLLRTLLRQNAPADRDGGGGGGAPLRGLDQEQLRALLPAEVADRAATGDSPPDKPR